jgi:hypothetical protein
MLKKPLLKSSYDPENPRDWKNHLAGEPVKVRKTNFEIPDESEGLPSTAASYAYWVGDEGVKAKVNHVNVKKGENVWDDLSVASEPNLETGFGITFSPSIEEERQNIISLGMFAEIDGVTGDPTTKSNRLAAHYHGLTTESYGVLADVRTGGLKRDLSSAFAVESGTIWEKDFQGYLYQDRIYYMKNLSFKPTAFANEWNDQSSGQFAPTIDDKNTILAGPRWSVLKDFHNKWKDAKSDSAWDSVINNPRQQEEKLMPDGFPRIVGDNNIYICLLNAPIIQTARYRSPFVIWWITLIILLREQYAPSQSITPLFPPLLSLNFLLFQLGRTINLLLQCIHPLPFGIPIIFLFN